MLLALIVATPTFAEPSANLATVDAIVVIKSQRTMYLYSRDAVIRTYPIALGPSPRGPKEQVGDGRTPEGRYFIESRNEKSAYHRALRVSYPSPEDRRAAQSRGVSPGGDIMIHGLPNGVAAVGEGEDWTRGCIAVANSDIEEIWQLVRDRTPIEIRP